MAAIILRKNDENRNKGKGEESVNEHGPNSHARNILGASEYLRFIGNRRHCQFIFLQIASNADFGRDSLGRLVQNPQVTTHGFEIQRHLQRLANIRSSGRKGISSTLLNFLSMTLVRLKAAVLRIAAWLTPARLRDAGFCLLFASMMVVIQYRSGAFTADLASIPDEPAHAVSCLLVRDYVVQGFPHNPVHFALDFYAHYPKVAIGHWPPLFYFGEGFWMLFAGRTRVALLLFVALCGAALLSSVFFVVRRVSSTAPALVSVAVLAGSTVFAWILFGVEPEILLALMIFWAAVHCGEYMNTGSRRSRNLFLAFTIVALLVHPRGAVLFLLPFTLLPLRPRIVKWKWLTAGLVLLLLLLIPPLIHQSGHVIWSGAPYRAWRIIRRTVLLTGRPWAVMALIAMLLVFRQSRERQFWAAIAGLAAASIVFLSLIPVPSEYRYWVILALVLAVLAGGGTHVLLERASRYRKTLSLTFCAAAIAWIVWTTAHVPAKPNLGYGKMIENCLLCGDKVALISGDGMNEGALIVEASLWDPNRLHTVLRGSKTLAKSSWMGARGQLLFASSSEVLKTLDHAHVSLILVQTEFDEDLRRKVSPWTTQLRTALEQDPAEWRLVPGASQVNGVEVYRKIPAQGVPPNGPAH